MQNDRSNKSADFLITEYNSITQYILKNSELGEKRVNLFIALATVLGSALGLLNILGLGTLSGNKLSEYIGLAMLVSMLLFGIVTFKRIVKRSEDMDRYQDELLKIRNYFVENDHIVGRYSSPYPYDKDYSGVQFRDIVCLQNGSLWVTVGLLNSILSWLLVFSGITFSISKTEPNWSEYVNWSNYIIYASLGSLAAWIIRFLWRKFGFKGVVTEEC